MQPLAAVAEPVAVVAAVDDVQQPARGPRVGVVVDGEEPAEGVERQVERVPEAGGDALEPRAVGPAAIDVAPLAAAGERRPVAADQPIVGPQVLAQAEVDVAREVEGEARRGRCADSCPASRAARSGFGGSSALPSPSVSRRRKISQRVAT